MTFVSIFAPVLFNMYCGELSPTVVSKQCVRIPKRLLFTTGQRKVSGCDTVLLYNGDSDTCRTRPRVTRWSTTVAL